MTDHLDLSDRAAKAVRELNHRTRGPDAFTGPAQLYRLVADLSLLVGMLPQLLGQLEGWLNTEHDADRVRADNHGDPGPIVDAATICLGDAGDAAHELADLLSSAHQYLATLGAASPPDDPKKVPERRLRTARQRLADQAARPDAGRGRADRDDALPGPASFDDDSDRRINGRDHPVLPPTLGQRPS